MNTPSNRWAPIRMRTYGVDPAYQPRHLPARLPEAVSIPANQPFANQQGEKRCRLKFYADSPDGLTRNKYFVYQVYDLDHGADIGGRFLREGWQIRAAFLQLENKKSIKLAMALLEQVKDQSQQEVRKFIHNKLYK